MEMLLLLMLLHLHNNKTKIVLKEIYILVSIVLFSLLNVSQLTVKRKSLTYLFYHIEVKISSMIILMKNFPLPKNNIIFPLIPSKIYLLMIKLENMKKKNPLKIYFEKSLKLIHISLKFQNTLYIIPFFYLLSDPKVKLLHPNAKNHHNVHIQVLYNNGE